MHSEHAGVLEDIAKTKKLNPDNETALKSALESFTKNFAA